MSFSFLDGNSGPGSALLQGRRADSEVRGGPALACLTAVCVPGAAVGAENPGFQARVPTPSSCHSVKALIDILVPPSAPDSHDASQKVVTPSLLLGRAFSVRVAVTEMSEG